MLLGLSLAIQLLPELQVLLMLLLLTQS